ncbi:hypothetical protein MKZ17_10775 [Solibacillus sp. FSL R7-0682]|uniref:hypothetical protein n=1 Tax=Solibacillus sp. FSL R7-0682 TaxID=2921690 RepID=UPI0030F4CAE8
MKKGILAFSLGTICIFILIFVIYNKDFYPSLPIESLSKRDVIKIINHSEKPMEKLTDEDGFAWYITSEQDMSIVDDTIKKLVDQNKWIYKDKEGSGLIFEKQEKKLIVTTQKWTGKYVIVKIPINFND